MNTELDKVSRNITVVKKRHLNWMPVQLKTKRKKQKERKEGRRKERRKKIYAKLVGIF